MNIELGRGGPVNFGSSTTKIAVGAILVFSVFLTLSLLLPGREPYLPVLIVGIIFAGIPHGALDIFILQRLARFEKNFLAFLALYVVALTAMAMAWIFVPEGAFLFFALYSCYHFALSDTAPAATSRAFLLTSRLEFCARFLAPFAIPFGLHSDRSLALADLVQKPNVFASLTDFFEVAAYAAIALSALVAIMELLAYFKTKSEWRALSLEPLVVCILFFKLDPIYAFGIYFSFIHSIKHIINVVNSPIKIDFKVFLPYWLIPLAAIIVLVYFSTRLTPGPAVGLSQELGLLKWSIILISAIALPHTILIYMNGKTTRSSQ